jgi:hypothetical protein
MQKTRVYASICLAALILFSIDNALACNDTRKVQYEEFTICYYCGFGYVLVDDCIPAPNYDCGLWSYSYRTCYNATCSEPVQVGVMYQGMCAKEGEK